MAKPGHTVHRAPRVAVLGAGSWGTTFAKILADGGADVMLWARRPELAREINEAKRNSDYLPGINLPRHAARDVAPRPRPRRRRAGLPVGAEPDAAREPRAPPSRTSARTPSSCPS